VIINARTGSVVLTQMVRVSECAVSHGNLSISISREQQVSQPLPFSQGETVVTEQAQVQVQEQTSKIMLIPASASLSDVVKALNAVGATPSDLLAILQAMKAAGALKAELRSRDERLDQEPPDSRQSPTASRPIPNRRDLAASGGPQGSPAVARQFEQLMLT
jgi:hypothetical protein